LATRSRVVEIRDRSARWGASHSDIGNALASSNLWWYRTVKASLVYQNVVSGRDAEIAAALSELAATESH
jgi:hypothetical protein